MFKQLGTFVSRHWLLVILAWVAIVAGLSSVSPRWDDVTNDGDLAYLPDKMTTIRGEHLLAKAFPDNKSKSQIVLAAVREHGTLTAEDLETLERLGGRFAKDGHAGLPIVDVWTPNSDIVGKKLLSPDRHAALCMLHLPIEFMAVQNKDILATVIGMVDEAKHAADFPAGLTIGVSGSAAIGGDMMASAQESIKHTEVTTLLLVLVILALVYRAPVLVIIPLATIVVSIVVATDLVALLTQAHLIRGLEWLDFKVFKTTKIFVVTILFGSGTDFCLFLISRYREEIEHGSPRAQALATALGHVGDAITASAATTIFGLSMMFFADFGKFRNSGPAIGLCLLVTLIACLTLAPAMLRAFGRVVFWPFAPGQRGPEDAGRAADRQRPQRSLAGSFWHIVSDAIIARPGLILVTSVLLLAPLAYQGLSVEISYDLLSDLDPGRPSVVGTRSLQKHFPPGELGPVTVLAYKADGGFDQPAGAQAIARLTKTLYEVEGVASVRSISEPLGDTPGLSNPLSPAGRRKLAALRNPRTKANFVSQIPQMAGQVTRLDVVLKHDPFSPAAAASLVSLDAKLQAISREPNSPWRDTQFDFLGVTAGTRDLKAVTQSDEVLIQRLVVLAVLGILIAVLRRPLICAYLILSVLFSYYVTIGATELLFSHVFEGFVGLDWKVPIFLFVILIAVGEDYNIYLATRVFEEQRRWGPVEGLRQAVIRTGGIITSCGVIMAGTFISMMTGTLRGMLELGFALTLGVMLDTIVVRPILVPAFLALLYKRQERHGARAEAPPLADEPVPAEIASPALSERAAHRPYRAVGS